MKRNILILFAIVSLLISLTGCGGSGSSNSIAPTPTTMTSVKVSLTQNGQAVIGAEAALYTPAAAMREGLNQAQTSASSRASIGANNAEGVYSPTSKSTDGIYTFTVPTGEYTLIASKGNYKTVVTNVRAASGDSVAEGDGTSTVETKLQPTGTITGKVATGTAPMVTGAIVFLEKTSSVAIANADGSFTMTGVPVNNDKPYSIAAMSNQNGMMFTTQAKQVTMTESLSASVSGDLELKGLNGKYEISGYVKGSDGGIANVLVMASNDIIFSVGRTDNNGKFSVYVNDEDTYILSVIGSVEVSKSVTVSASGNNPTETNLVFTINPTEAPSYCCIKGSIQIPQSFLTSCGSDIKDVPDFGRYLVRLIGSSTANTSYNSSMKADFKASLTQSETLVEYAFDSVPEGTYSVLVDPAGNGFLGSVGNISVSAGDTKTVDTINVKFVKPVFNASAGTYNVQISKIYPFEIINLTGYYKKVGSDSSLLRGSVSPSGDTIYFFDSGENNFVTTNGEYEIVLQNEWTDSNTGITATLTGSQVIKYDEVADAIGNTKVIKYNASSDPKFTSDHPFNYDGLVKFFNNIVSYCDGSNSYFYCKSSPSVNYDEKDPSEVNRTLDISGKYAVCIGGDDWDSLIFFNGETNTTIENYDSVSSADVNFSDTYGYSIESASIFGDKHIAYCLNYETSDEIYKNVIKYVVPSSPTSHTVIDSFNNSNSSSSSCDFPYYVRLSSSNTPYLLVLFGDNFDKISATKTTIKIYDCETKVCLVSYGINTKIKGVKDFQVLKDGSFYVEINDSYVDSPIGSGFYYSMRFVSGNPSSSPIETSNFKNRKSCFMDKHGFMYRIDTNIKKVIKTTSLDGEPLESLAFWTNTMSDGTTITIPIQDDLNGILGLEEDSSGSSTLYVW